MANGIDYETYLGTVKKWTGPEIAAALGEIADPLGKPAYGWPFGKNILDAEPDSWLAMAAEQVIRLMGSAAIRLADGPSVMGEDLDNISGLVTGDDPPIVVNYSPLRQATVDLDDYGTEFWGEVTEFVDRIAWLKTSGVNVVAVFLDHEKYVTDEPMALMAGIDTPTPEASILREKLANFYRPAKSMFPDANVSFYNAHGFHPAATKDGTGWQEFPKFPATGLTDSSCCSLYYPERFNRNVETIRRTLAGQPNTGIIPCVSLASKWVNLGKPKGWDQHPDLQSYGKPQTRVWVDGFDYPRANSWYLGMVLHHEWCNMPDQLGRFIATVDDLRGNAAVDAVFFWPEPMDHAMELEWLVHFHAFVRGSTADKTVEL